MMAAISLNGLYGDGLFSKNGTENGIRMFSLGKVMTWNQIQQHSTD